MSKVLIFRSINVPPQEEVEEGIAPLLARGYRVVSANTSLAPVGEMDWKAKGAGNWVGIARHVYYVTTVVLDLPRDPAVWRT